MRTFAAAGFAVTILKIIGWIYVVAGFVVGGFSALGALFAPGEFGILDSAGMVVAGLLGGGMVIAGGVILIGLAQIGEAAVVAATNSEQILVELKRMQAASGAPVGQSAPVYRQAPAAHAMPAPSISEQIGVNHVKEDVIKRYKGRTLLRVAGGVKVDGEDQVFRNVLEAERFVNEA